MYLSQVQDAVKMAELQQVRTLLHSSIEGKSWCKIILKHTHVWHAHTPGLKFLAGSTAAGEQVGAQQTQPLAQAVGLSHGLRVLHQLRVQLLQVEERLLFYLSQQPQGLRTHLTHTHTQVIYWSCINLMWSCKISISWTILNKGCTAKVIHDY